MRSDNLSLFSNNDFDSHVLPDSVLSDKILNWITELYDDTDWRWVKMDQVKDREYDGVPIVSYFKALALPYLINIPLSERGLGKLILKRDKLQKLCGFRIGSSRRREDSNSEIDKPLLGSRTFWHFRKKYKTVYSEIITKVLISLVLSGKYPKLNLPFVKKIEEKEFNHDGNLVSWPFDGYRPAITISLSWTENDLSTHIDREDFRNWKKEWSKRFRQCKDFDDYRNLKAKYDVEYKGFARKTKKGFTEEITFPIDVSTKLASGEKLFFRLTNPDWFIKDPDISRKLSWDNDLPQRPLQRSKYNKACNILLIRELQGEKEILLSRRRGEGVGEGSFAAPGGKQREGETLQKCAIRELKEETGVTLESSKPVSIFHTLQDSGKQITSVGVLAEHWTGDIETKEPDKHVGWEWHKLSNLPQPIFEYTKIAITQFLEDKYPNLTWDDLEEKPSAQLSMFENFTDGMI